MFDIIIGGGKVINGTGGPWFKADIGIKDGQIAVIGDLTEAEAGKTIDASGLVVSPGFIDAHSHSDSALLANAKAESKIRQGVTTEVIGQCGSSAAPLSEKERAKADDFLSDWGVECTWLTMGEYIEALETQGVSLNVVPLVGHGTVRRVAVGLDNRRPTADEMDQMKILIEEGMEAGAFGLSTGLIYVPGTYSETEEIIELAGVAAKHGGVYLTHMRNEGGRLIESIEEAIRIGREAGLPVQISHHKTVGKENWGKVHNSLALMEAVRADEGLQITCDQYPYTATSTSLGSILPSWALEGGWEKVKERFADIETREEIRSAIQADLARYGGWDKVLISRVRNDELEQYVGLNMNEAAETLGMPPATAALHILEEDQMNTGMVRFGMCEEDVRHVMRHPLVMVGTDGSAIAPYGPLGKGKPHPRSYGTFPRVLGKYVREEGVLRLEEAVRKMTSLPAQSLGIKGRGLLVEGFRADITVFNPDTIIDRATFVDPHQYPEGIEYVIVNGEIVIDQEEHTGALPGLVLKRNRQLF